VRERLARIIASDAAGHQSSFDAKDTELSTTIESLDDTLEKWKIPASAHEAFRAVSFDSLLYVGEKQLVLNGPEALLSLPPTDLHILFSPVLVAMQDAGTMASWYARTEVLARTSFPEAEGDFISTLLPNHTKRDTTASIRADLKVLKALSNEYRMSLETKQIQSMAKFASYRQTARLAVLNMLMYYTVVVSVLMTVAEVSFRDAMLFNMYSITSAGFGSVTIPHHSAFLIFVVVAEFVGVPFVAILVSILSAMSGKNGETPPKIAYQIYFCPAGRTVIPILTNECSSLPSFSRQGSNGLRRSRKPCKIGAIL
jgi:hypothetical protein